MTNEHTGTSSQASQIAIFVSGSCSTQLEVGGFAANLFRLSSGEKVKSLTRVGSATGTTCNRMELAAAIAAIKNIKENEPDPILIYSTSKYLTDNGNTGYATWTARGWRNGKGKAILNAELWRELFSLCASRNVTFMYLPRSEGHPDLQSAYDSATKAREKQERKAAMSLFGAAA